MEDLAYSDKRSDRLIWRNALIVRTKLKHPQWSAKQVRELVEEVSKTYCPLHSVKGVWRNYKIKKLQDPTSDIIKALEGPELFDKLAER